MEPWSRRAVVKTAVIGGIASLSGCTSGIQQMSQSIGGGGNSFVRKWLPAPEELPNSNSELYQIRYSNPQKIEESSELSVDVVSYFDPEQRYQLVNDANLDMEQFSRNLQSFAGTVLQGDFKRDDVISELEQAGYNDADEYEDFVYIEREDHIVGAIGNSIIIIPESQDTLETIIDLKTGDTDSWVSESDQFKTLSGYIGAPINVSRYRTTSIETSAPRDGRFQGLLGRSMTLVPKGEMSTIKIALLFEDEMAAHDVDRADYEEWLTKSSVFNTEVEIKNVKRKKEVTVIVAEGETSEI